MATRVKICGLTRIEDVRAAVEAGADALGFVFEKSSSRYVGDVWPELSKQIPPFVYRVGVFGPAPQTMPDGLHAIQALWNDTPLTPEGIDLICTVRGRSEPIRIHQQAASRFRAFLLDAYDPKAYGGTGKAVNAEIARQFVLSSSIPVILAGGLTPANVAAAIEQVKPFGVDVSSGIESTPGVKSDELIWQFVKNARKANTQ